MVEATDRDRDRDREVGIQSALHDTNDGWNVTSYTCVLQDRKTVNTLPAWTYMMPDTPIGFFLGF